MTLSRKPVAAGRPKDPEKRSAILAAGKRLFPQYGFEGTSMDAVAAEAGVSKLTVYSHFNDKETLFVEVVRAKCEEQLPPDVFLVDPKGPIDSQLLAIARGFFGLVTSEESISLHRMLAAQSQASMRLSQLFWEAGPRRILEAFEAFLRAEVAEGQLDIADVPRAASQFFCLLKGELHARLLCGCSEPLCSNEVDAHLRATVDMFLRAYASR